MKGRGEYDETSNNVKTGETEQKWVKWANKTIRPKSAGMQLASRRGAEMRSIPSARQARNPKERLTEELGTEK